MKAALSPGEALAVSRERLSQALLHTATGQATAAPWAGPGEPLPPLPPLPPAALVAALMRRWWRRHPWRQAGALAVQAADVLVRPVAQSHPLALMVGAASAGAVLVWLRPWRWLGAAWRPLSGALLPNLLRDLLKPPSSH